MRACACVCITANYSRTPPVSSPAGCHFFTPSSLCRVPIPLPPSSVHTIMGQRRIQRFRGRTECLRTGTIKWLAHARLGLACAWQMEGFDSAMLDAGRMLYRVAKAGDHALPAHTHTKTHARVHASTRRPTQIRTRANHRSPVLLLAACMLLASSSSLLFWQSRCLEAQPDAWTPVFRNISCFVIFPRRVLTFHAGLTTKPTTMSCRWWPLSVRSVQLVLAVLA